MLCTDTRPGRAESLLPDLRSVCGGIALMLGCQGSPCQVGDHVVHAAKACLAQAYHVGQIGGLCTRPGPLKADFERV